MRILHILKVGKKLGFRELLSVRKNKEAGETRAFGRGARF